MLKGLWKSLVHPSPRGKVRWAFFLVIILAVATSIFVYPQGWNKLVDQADSWLDAHVRPISAERLKVGGKPFQLGLDLSGGAHLVYEANLSQIPEDDQDEAMEGVRDVIERRVNLFGVAEPLVQTARAGNNRRVVVELAGIKDVKAAIAQIGETPVLEFKETATPEPQRELTPAERREMDSYNKAASDKVNQIAKELRAQEVVDFAALAKKYSEDQTSKDLGGALGFVTRDSAYGEFWQWAYDNGSGKVSVVPIENAEGWNFIQVGQSEDRGQEVHAQHILICFRGAERCEQDISKDDARKKAEELKKLANADNFEKLARENSTEPGAKERSGDLGFFAHGMMVKPFEDAVFALKNGEISDLVETQFGFHLIRKLEERQAKAYHLARILIRKKTAADFIPAAEPWRNTGLSGKHLIRSVIQFDPNTNTPEVGLEFNDEGKRLFAELTTRNVGNIVAIFLDGVPISAPRVQTAITDGRAVITGQFTIAEAKLLAQRLNAGALPVPITLLSQRTVGATLGEASIKASLKAGLIGFALVALFMILMYRLAGVLAVCALLLYCAVVLTLFKLIPVTLTLSGIAGFILSIGMAVDANVLQFERLKEEVKSGKSLQSGIEDAFVRAWPSIRDSHLTTLFGALILFWFSTSLVKGFGLTLSIGVVMSLFSAITVTRVLLRMVVRHVQGGFWYGAKARNTK